MVNKSHFLWKEINFESLYILGKCSGGGIPTYVLFCLASMRLKFGDNLVILNNKNIGNYIDKIENPYGWKFSPGDEVNNPVRSIVAKSDYIRAAVVEKHGGIWLDADTLALRRLPDELNKPTLDNDKLHFYSEAFFAANPGNEKLGKAAQNMISSEFQQWGKLGGLKEDFQQNIENFVYLSPNYIVPHYSGGAYGYATREVILSSDVGLDDFKIHDNQFLLILYNTALSSLSIATESPRGLIESNILLAKILRWISPDIEWWLEEVENLKNEIES